MDDSLSSISENSFVITEMEKAALEDIERFYKEADEDLKDAFHKFANENEHESEEETDSESVNDEDQKENLHNDRPFGSEKDGNSTSFVENSILHQNNSEYGNKVERRNSCSESGTFTPFHSVFVSHVPDKHDSSSTTSETRQNSTNPNEKILVSNPYDERKLDSRALIHSALSDSSIVVKALDEEYQQLFISCEAKFLELNILKEKEMNCKKEMQNAVKTLKLNLDLLESEKDKLEHNLRDSKKLLLNFERGEDKVEEILSLKSQLLSLCEIEDEIQHKLETSKAAMYSLEIQLNNLHKAGHFSQCDYHSNILEEMKLHHEKNILICRQHIDKLQSKLNSKTEEAKELALKNSELQKKHQQLEIEKSQWVNRMSEEFVAQKKCQLFLESGTIEEIKRLRHQVHQLEEEKSNIERENSLLKKSFLRRWAHSLLSWQLQHLRRVNDMLGLPFF